MNLFSDIDIMKFISRNSDDRETIEFCTTIAFIPGKRYTIGDKFEDNEGIGEYIFADANATGKLTHGGRRQERHYCSLDCDANGRYYLSPIKNGPSVSIGSVCISGTRHLNIGRRFTITFSDKSKISFKIQKRLLIGWFFDNGLVHKEEQTLATLPLVPLNLIGQFLNLTDLKNGRLVCKQWQEGLKRQFRKRGQVVLSLETGKATNAVSLCMNDFKSFGAFDMTLKLPAFAVRQLSISSTVKGDWQSKLASDVDKLINGNFLQSVTEMQLVLGLKGDILTSNIALAIVRIMEKVNHIHMNYTLTF